MVVPMPLRARFSRASLKILMLALGVEHVADQRLDRHARGDLAGRRAAHAVADDQQRAARPERVVGELVELARGVVEAHHHEAVLVVLADEANVGAPGQMDRDRTGRARRSPLRLRRLFGHHYGSYLSS
jgi:hypothetical protein